MSKVAAAQPICAQTAGVRVVAYWRARCITTDRFGRRSGEDQASARSRRRHGRDVQPRYRPTSLGDQRYPSDGRAGNAQGHEWPVDQLHGHGPRAEFGSVPYPVAGRLYEATVKADALVGTVMPAVIDFNARTESGDNYRVLPRHCLQPQ
jgi:hypothetical protein